MNDLKKAYVAGGCFWGMEELFRKQTGVVDTEVGYTGGENENPTCENHGRASKDTARHDSAKSHAEAMEITYDPNQTSFLKILEYFFRIHNPTTLNRQGNDIGSSYRSAIFYQNEEDRNIAEEYIKKVNESGLWKNEGEVVTALEPFTKFWSAEGCHQDYLQKNPGGYTCHYER
jgi:peptide-methionine (S)-S-oxide reductase